LYFLEQQLQHVGKRYKFINILGSGSFGNTYLVECDRKYYALKEIKCDEAETKQMQDAKKEADTMTKISSEYLVHFVETFVIDYVVYICMLYCDGGTVAEKKKKKRRVGGLVLNNITKLKVDKIFLEIVLSKNCLLRL
jgi:serine/threonine protein kinase